MRAAALILAAGQGVRLGADLPKAHVRLAGQSVLARSAGALGTSACVDAVLPVVGPGAEPWISELRAGWKGPARLLEGVQGGTTRQASVACGLAALERQRPGCEWVLVHDAARCLVEPADADRVLRAARETGAAIPVVAVRDTLKQVSGERVVGTLDRAGVVRAQTPQAFRTDLLRRALVRAGEEGFEGTDCASLVERIGASVVACPGREANFKLTTPEDLDRMRALLEGNAGPPPDPREGAA